MGYLKKSFQKIVNHDSHAHKKNECVKDCICYEGPSRCYYWFKGKKSKEHRIYME